MASNSYIDIQYQMNPCYNNPETESNEKQAMLTDGNSGSRYTEEYYSPEPSDTEDSVSVYSEISSPKEALQRFSRVFIVSMFVLELFGICCIVMVTCWMVYFHDGLAWDGSKREFNWHPIFMVAGLFCYANAALTSYVLRGHSESLVHYLHFLVLMMTFIFIVFGMVSSLTTHTRLTAKFYSFHSWMGVAMLVLFVIQIVVGFIGLFPKCENTTRKKYLKFQIWICVLVLSIGIGTSLLGNAEKLTNNFALSLTSFSYEGLLTNMLSLFLLAFGCMVSTVLMHPIYRST